MNKIIIFTALIAVITIAAFYFHTDGDFDNTTAITLAQSGSFELDMTPDQALPLFTAPGEKLWISHWDPTILNGDGFEKGTVFITSDHGATTYWTVMDYDTKTHHALYMRTTPEQDIGTVDVRLTPNGKGGSTVQVSYQLTGLSNAGNDNLQTLLDSKNYAQMMKDWQAMIISSTKNIEGHFAKSSPQDLPH